MLSKEHQPLIPVLIFLLAALMLGTACNLPAEIQGLFPSAAATASPPPPPTATPQPLPPAVVETDPPAGSTIGLKQPITFYFNQAMDRNSVEAAFNGQPGITGKLTWQSASILEFIPDQELVPGIQQIFELGTNAQAANGLGLQEALKIKFYTPDELRAVNYLPVPDGEQIDPASAVAVSFNQPMVPLGNEKTILPDAFEISPAVVGEGSWINTSTYIFKPDKGMSGGAEYQVELNPDLVSAAGTSLADDVRMAWSFTTTSPRVENWEPVSSDSNVDLDAVIKLSFNQAMDQERTANLLKIFTPSGEEVAGEITWSDDSRDLEFTPVEYLARGTRYSVVLPGEAQSAGGSVLGEDLTWSFETVGELTFQGVPGGQMYSPSIYEGVTLYFNSPLNLKNIQELIQFSPEVEDVRPYLGGTDNVLNISGDFIPQTTYSLVLKEGLSDRWGSVLTTPVGLSFTTAPLRPQLLVTPGNNDLFITADENSIPAAASSLYQVSLNVGTIPEQAYSTVLNPTYSSQLEDYFPGDVQFWSTVLNVPGDDSYQVDLPLNPAGTSLDPGLYRYQVTSNELSYNAPPFILAVSDIHLMMKTSPEGVLVWAVDLRNNQPVRDTEVRIYDLAGNLQFEGETDQDGLYQVDFEVSREIRGSTYYAVSGTSGEEDFGVTVSSWGNGIEPYEFNIRPAYDVPGPTTHIYTDRPIYRPGQTVYYRIIERIPESSGYRLPDREDIDVKIRTTSGDTIEETLPLSQFGTAHGEIKLSEFAQPGLFAIFAGENVVNFQVANYRKPEIDLSIELEQEQGKVENPLQAAVRADYYFNAPASGVPVIWSLRALPVQFTLPGYHVGELNTGWYRYQGINYSRLYGAVVASGEVETDNEGAWNFSQDLPLESPSGWDVTLPARYELEVTAADESGFPVSNRAGMLIHPEDFYIGLNPSSWVVLADQEIYFDIKVVDWEKNSAGIRNLKAEFSKINWSTEYNEVGIASHQREAELISSSNVRTGSNGEARAAFTPTEPGTYQLTVRGGEAVSEVLVWVGGPGSAAWPVLEQQKVKLVADQETYQPGDTARIFIPNPFPDGALALVTVEREEVNSAQLVEMGASGETVEVPITETEIPNLYVSATIIGKDDQGRSDFRQGYLNLEVDYQSRILAVEIVGEPEILEPRQEVRFRLRVEDQDGNPVQGEFSLSVVDKAVLALADPYAEDIDTAFFSIRPLSVRIGIPLGIQAGRNLMVAGGIGGGGDGADMSIRKEFEDTGYWNAEIVTNDQGEAEVTFLLPDNLTTWQAEARGITEDTLVGQGTAEIVTTKDLLVRPVTPRFLVAGDHLALAALVHNNTDQDLEVVVSLTGSGFQLDNPANSTQEILIPAGDRSRVEWWGTAEDTGNANLTFSAEGGGLEDEVKPYQGPLPVLQYTSPQTYATAGVLEDPGQKLEVVSLPRSFVPGEGELNVELSPSLAAALLSALDALEKDQVFSNIDAVSYLVPHAVTYQTLQQLELDYPLLEERLGEIITYTLDNLETTQNDDGGWGWWKGGGSSVEITSAVLMGLIRAQESGVFVDEVMLENARGYLLAALPSTAMLTQDYQFDQLAFQYFALSESGIQDLGGLSALAAEQSRMNPYGKAFLALTLDQKNPGDSTAVDLISDLQSAAVRTATGVHWENSESCRCGINSPTTTTALVLYAVQVLDPDSTLIPDAVRYLVSARSERGDWRSYYETGWAVLALNQVLVESGELESDYSYSARVNDTDLISGQTQGGEQLDAAAASIPLVDLYPEDPNALTIQHGEGEGNLYYTAHLKVSQPASEVEAFGRGISLSRLYLAPGVENQSILTQEGQVGDLLQVQLTLTLEQDSYYLTLDDYFPAGSEVLDTRLKTTQQVAPEFDSRAPFRGGWGWWYFLSPEVYDDHLSWSADYLPAGTYQINYTISLVHPGEYQVLPARAAEVFFPETQAVSAGDRFVIAE